MKHSLFLILLFVSSVICAQDKEDIPQIPNIPNVPKMEQHKGVIQKVFFAMQGDARYVAYQVKWKEQEIIIVDMMGGVPKEKGEKIEFMSMVMKMPDFAGGGAPRSILQFTVIPDVDKLLKDKK